MGDRQTQPLPGTGARRFEEVEWAESGSCRGLTFRRARRLPRFKHPRRTLRRAWLGSGEFCRVGMIAFKGLEAYDSYKPNETSNASISIHTLVLSLGRISGLSLSPFCLVVRRSCQPYLQSSSSIFLRINTSFHPDSSTTKLVQSRAIESTKTLTAPFRTRTFPSRTLRSPDLWTNIS